VRGVAGPEPAVDHCFVYSGVRDLESDVLYVDETQRELLVQTG